MKTWVLYAVISMIFAGCTSVIAKLGLAGISSDLGLAVRTAFVFVLVLAFAGAVVPPGELARLQRVNFLWLGLSGVTTSLSWIFYYKALKEGKVSTVALIDKASVVVAILLATLILKERISMRTVGGATLMVGGLLLLLKS